jgi:hypothetical protein
MPDSVYGIEVKEQPQVVIRQIFTVHVNVEVFIQSFRQSPCDGVVQKAIVWEQAIRDRLDLLIHRTNLLHKMPQHAFVSLKAGNQKLLGSLLGIVLVDKPLGLELLQAFKVLWKLHRVEKPLIEFDPRASQQNYFPRFVQLDDVLDFTGLIALDSDEVILEILMGIQNRHAEN